MDGKCDNHPPIGIAWEAPAARGGIFGRNDKAMKEEKLKPPDHYPTTAFNTISINKS